MSISLHCAAENSDCQRREVDKELEKTAVVGTVTFELQPDEGLKDEWNNASTTTSLSNLSSPFDNRSRSSLQCAFWDPSRGDWSPQARVTLGYGATLLFGAGVVLKWHLY